MFDMLVRLLESPYIKLSHNCVFAAVYYTGQDKHKFSKKLGFQIYIIKTRTQNTTDINTYTHSRKHTDRSGSHVIVTFLFGSETNTVSRVDGSQINNNRTATTAWFRCPSNLSNKIHNSVFKTKYVHCLSVLPFGLMDTKHYQFVTIPMITLLHAQ